MSYGSSVTLSVCLANFTKLAFIVALLETAWVSSTGVDVVLRFVGFVVAASPLMSSPMMTMLFFFEWYSIAFSCASAVLSRSSLDFKMSSISSIRLFVASAWFVKCSKDLHSDSSERSKSDIPDWVSPYVGICGMAASSRYTLVVFESTAIVIYRSAIKRTDNCIEYSINYVVFS